ncbi:hypothetical protein I6N95_13710 [Vagococcus sp. BWB3-3]|uniref:Uncharacterized protein n=1 Tax=Vagococcus allomyrinae TaxID=2794353 RepID=A0A940SX70_9ENTE|nr:hypothetical protein [Vagococcus allomyrinae]MBP1042073.1 hypothetical protein [Vagococcus allomyrinae]
MSKKIEVSVYQHPTFEEGSILFQENTLLKLLEKCESLFLKTNPKSKYPREEVEKRFTQLLQAVSLEKSVRIRLTEDNLSWDELLEQLTRYYPQMVWTLGKKIAESEGEYSFEFIPLVINLSGFPFGTTLSQSLIQQGVSDSGDIIEEWENELSDIVTDSIGHDQQQEEWLSPIFENELHSDISQEEQVFLSREEERLTEPFEEPLPVEEPAAVELEQVVEISRMAEPIFVEPEVEEDEPLVTIEEVAEDDPWLTDDEAKLKVENDYLRAEQARLKESNERLQEEISALNERAVALQEQYEVSTSTTDLNKQALYYEEALRRERDSKERMRVAKDKLEHLVSRLERQVTENSLTVIEGEIPYVERKEDWYQKKHIDVLEYDQLYQKARYLEHTWQINQRLIVISERMTIDESEMKYERERVNRLKHSTKDIELFVMMDECKMINERVKVRQGFLWMKPRVTIMTADYENLVEKAAYFDVIQSENQILERIIEDHVESTESFD